MPKWAQKWIDIGLSCEPADREAAEAAYRDCYRYANLCPDVPIVWVSSPIVGAFAAHTADLILMGSAVDSAISAVFGDVDSAVFSAMESAGLQHECGTVDSAVCFEVGSAVNLAVYSAVYSAVGLAVGSARGSFMVPGVRSAVRPGVRSAVRPTVSSAVRSAVRSAVCSAVGSTDHTVWVLDKGVREGVHETSNIFPSTGGQFTQDGPSFESFFLEICGLDLGNDLNARAAAYMQTVKSAGQWWPNKKFIIACDRPLFIKRDNAGRLHNDTGHAIEWRDGWGVHAWHGLDVPGDWIERKDSLTPKIALMQNNIEQRRAACEILGWEKILSELSATIIDRDNDPLVGELIEVILPYRGPEKFLRVTCGTGRKFVLPVPPEMATALEANAWSYGVDKDFIKKLEVRT